MKFTPLPFNGLCRVTIDRLEDVRGYFGRSFCAEEFEKHGLFSSIAQANVSVTDRKGSIRGLHFQAPPKAEAKLVRVVRGSIFDVAVDLRRTAPSFGRWWAEELSAENGHMFYIPEGFAHGFQTLTDDVEMQYLHSVPYAPELSGGVFYDDPDIGITWPLSQTIVSSRDKDLPPLKNLGVHFN